MIFTQKHISRSGKIRKTQNIKRIRALINTPSLSEVGGVADHYLGLKDKFSCYVAYNFIGGRSRNKYFFFFQIMDYLKFIKILRFKSFNIVHLNPSLDFKSIARDAIFLLIAKIIFNKKVLVFFHGWVNNTALQIEQIYKVLFKFVFNMADAFCVLAIEHKQALKDWGIVKPIYIETTKVDDNLLLGYKKKGFHKNMLNILFLARIERAKGIYEVLKAYYILKNKYNNISLIIAGTGSEAENIKKFVVNEKINGVSFLGYVRGKEKINTLAKGWVYILPTRHGEGLPTSLIEAMAFGMPIITRPIGGIKNMFINGKMGYMDENASPLWIVEKIEKLLHDKQLWCDISKYNYLYAKKHFMASIVAKRLEKIYLEMLKDFTFSKTLI